jgi:lipoprotein NlpD
MFQTRLLWLLVGVVGLSACAPNVRRLAPVEDRARITRSSDSGSLTPAAPLAGEPGTYVVQRGDTLAKIALDHGLSWRDLARWNQIDNPNLIEVGQVLRTIAPADAVRLGVSRPAVSPPPGRPLAPAAQGNPPAPIATSPAPVVSVLPPVASTTPSPSAAPQPAPAVAPPSAPQASTAIPMDDAPAFVWPAQGNLVAGFDEARNKGLDIAGKAGDAVLAAADGRVVYAGSGLRGYGNLIIIKHNNTYLTAYAHNRALLVKEDQDVQRGQKIAEMGNSDADQVKLHFEIRRQGKPVDPARLLPPR